MGHFQSLILQLVGGYVWGGQYCGTLVTLPLLVTPASHIGSTSSSPSCSASETASCWVPGKAVEGGPGA